MITCAEIIDAIAKLYDDMADTVTIISNDNKTK